MKSPLLVTVLAVLAYLTVLGLGTASIWTSRGIDLSAALGWTAALLLFGSLVGALVGAALLTLWEDWS